MRVAIVFVAPQNKKDRDAMMLLAQADQPASPRSQSPCHLPNSRRNRRARLRKRIFRSAGASERTVSGPASETTQRKLCTMLKAWVKSSSSARDSSRHTQRASDLGEEDELDDLHANELSHICWTLALKDLGRLHEFNLVAHRVTQRLVIAAHQGNCIPTRCITKRQH
jgi:hypothetical protein